jgi:4-amino-4-deoxy-L-arabinose transferase-like glycosyltransferase
MFVLAVVLAWSALPALLQPIPHADNVEQLNWSHAVQWGYLKHPPMPTWLLAAGIALFGPSAYLTYALAMCCVGATLLILWRCAREFLDADAAVLVVLLTSADYYLMGRGSFLNHNTVMLPFVAASAWAVLRILRSGEGWAWIVLGLAQAFGLLTKYQMAVVIAANGTALLALGAWRRPRFALHLTLASLCTILPLLPHVAWLEQNQFSTFTYAGHSLLADLPLGQRVVHTLGFLLQQVGRLAPAILAFGLALLLQRASKGGSSAHDKAGAAAPVWGDEAWGRSAQRAVAILAWTPLVFIVLLSTLGGVALQNHWGASSTLLLPLFAVARLRAWRLPPVRCAWVATFVLHAAAVAWNAVAAARAPDFHHSFAAQPLAAMALAHWQEKQPGLPQVVIGPDWEAGAIALELPSHPPVIASGDRRQAPWVSDERLAACGALVLWRPDQPAEQQIGLGFVQAIRDPIRLHTIVPGGRESQIAAGILPPTGGTCAAR